MNKEPQCPLCCSKNLKGFYRKNDIDLLSCLDCGFMFSYPQPDESELKKLYGKEYFASKNADQCAYKNYFDEEEAIHKSSIKRLAKISKYIKGGRLLDVGCATGFFIDTARSVGWKVAGTDISPFCTNIATHKFGLSVYTGTLAQLKLKPDSYDLITMWDLLEHVSDPVDEMQWVNKLLKSRGWVVIMTPNIKSMIARITRRRWILYQSPHIHLSYFSPYSIKVLLEKTGFRIIKIKKYWHGGKYVPFSYALERLSNYSPLFKPVQAFFKITKLDRWTPWLDIGDNMVIYARKGEKA